MPAAKNKSLSFQTVLFIRFSNRVPRWTAGYAKKKDLPYNAPRRGTKSPSSIDGSFSDFLHKKYLQHSLGGNPMPLGGGRSPVRKDASSLVFDILLDNCRGYFPDTTGKVSIGPEYPFLPIVYPSSKCSFGWPMRPCGVSQNPFAFSQRSFAREIPVLRPSSARLISFILANSP